MEWSNFGAGGVFSLRGEELARWVYLRLLIGKKRMVCTTDELRVLQVLERLMNNVLVGPSFSVALRGAALESNIRRIKGVHSGYEGVDEETWESNDQKIDTDDSEFMEWNEARDARPENFNVRVDGIDQLEPGVIVYFQSRDASGQFVQILKCYPFERMILFCECSDNSIPRLESLNHSMWVSDPPICRKFMRKRFTSYRDHGRFHTLRRW